MKKNGAMGWLPDPPDVRDYLVHSPKVEAIFEKNKEYSLQARTMKGAKPTSSVDLRAWCSPIEDQGDLGSCTAHAGVGLLEYYESRAFGAHLDASRLFLYKTTRNIMHWKGDTGAYLRKTMAAMAGIGVPPEEYWPYDVERYDEDPDAFVYALAANYKPTVYYRLDTPYMRDEKELLKTLQSWLRYGFPCMFGFTVYDSIEQSSKSGEIPFPSPKERVEGGHAVMVVGYDQKRKITNQMDGATTTGALLIRNSWGTAWGDAGYGWLPYEYLLKGQAVDFWTLIKSDYLDSGNFM